MDIQIKFIPISLLLFIISVVNSQDNLDKHRPNGIGDQPWSSLKQSVQAAKLLPTPVPFALESKQFGIHTSIDGDRALISARTILSPQGIVYIFDYDGNNWTRTAQILPNDGSENDGFGSALSLSGDRAIIGAQNSESAYVFELIDGNWTQMAKLTADGAFGCSVSILGDRVIIGAKDDDENGFDSGAAYIFELSGGNWSQTEKLIASDGGYQDNFGNSVSLTNDRVLIGAVNDTEESGDNGDDTGAAYIFDFSAGNWSETAKLTANDIAAGDNFGNSVSISGDRALIGAIHNDDDGPNSGSAYVFYFDDNSWSQTTKLTASDGAINDEFGGSVSLSGDRALIGAKFDDNIGNQSGSAYIFDFTAEIWSETIKLTAKDAAADDNFGNSVSLSGDRVLIGAIGDDRINITNSGSSYVFDLKFGSWLETAKLIAFEENEPSNGDSSNDFFASSVSISGNRALIGAYGDDEAGSRSGSAYIFDLISDNWVLTEKLTASDGAADDNFGWSVSLFGDRALIGSPSAWNPANQRSGVVYIFDLIDGNWSETTKLWGSNGIHNDFFGRSISLYGNKALIGATGLNQGSLLGPGSAYIFDLTDGNWSETQRLWASDGVTGDYFGSSVSLFVDTVLIGAEGNLQTTGGGQAYIFNLISEEWLQTAKLRPSNTSGNNRFGASVSLSGSSAWIGVGQSISVSGRIALIGTRYVSSSLPDQAYAFELIDGIWTESRKFVTNTDVVNTAYILELKAGSWSQTQTLMSNDEVPRNSFGNSVSLSGGNALIGADKTDSIAGIQSGVAYIYFEDLIFSNNFEE